MPKGHNHDAIVAFWQAFPASFRAVFGLGDMSIKFKRLVVSGLEISSKLAYFRPIIRPAKISQTQRAK
jgi:hypothetical protein